ncbi:MAG TPA: YceD family protein [Candidatus Angelobacter sp.]|nr:YceD family protein [Candidatus Angelobacter sp.]
MPLKVNLRHLEAHEVKLEGELPVVELDLDFQDDMCRAEKPLRYNIEIQAMDHELLVQGHLRLPLNCECVRCLKSFEHVLELKHWTRLLPLEGEEKTPVDNDCVDLTPYVREDILLEFPQHPLCETDCRGLPAKETGKAKKATKPGVSSQEPSAWADLDKLKF